jgi:hypothetical protein
MIRELLSYLPQNNRDDRRARLHRSRSTADAALDSIVPAESNQPYDIKDVIHRVVDDGEFFEVHEHWARNIVVGFARMDGRSVGIVANQPGVSGRLPGYRFVGEGRALRALLRRLQHPALTFEDVPGFLPGTAQEFGGIIRHGAKLLYAYAEATVPKITVITRKAYGGAYCVMGSKHMRTDVNLAWPTAEIAVMGAGGRGQHRLPPRTCRRRGRPDAVRRAEDRGIPERFANPFVAAERGFIDDVIEPRETRPRVIRALRMLETKVDTMPRKKHGNIPLGRRAASKWSVDPFGAVRKNGFIYARGAVDDKEIVTAGLMVMLLLQRAHIKLNRDVIFVAEAGEEGTPAVGIDFLVSRHWDEIAAEYALAEGGSAVAQGGNVRYVAIATAEKVPRGVRLIARGPAGHASRPSPDNAVVRLAAAVAKLGEWRTPMRLNDTTRAYFERLAHQPARRCRSLPARRRPRARPGDRPLLRTLRAGPLCHGAHHAGAHHAQGRLRLQRDSVGGRSLHRYPRAAR